jgi:hypothetical protein
MVHSSSSQMSSTQTHTPPPSLVVTQSQSAYRDDHNNNDSDPMIQTTSLTKNTTTKIQFVATFAMEFDPDAPTQHSLTPIPDAAQRFPIRPDPKQIQFEEMTKQNRHLLQAWDEVWNDENDDPIPTSIPESERRRRRRQSMYDASTSSDPAVIRWNHTNDKNSSMEEEEEDDVDHNNPSKKHHRTQRRRRQSMRNDSHAVRNTVGECSVQDVHPENHDHMDDDDDDDDDDSSDDSMDGIQLEKSARDDDTPRTLFHYRQNLDESYSDLKYEDDEDMPDLVEGSSSHSSQSNMDLMTETVGDVHDSVDTIVETCCSSQNGQTNHCPRYVVEKC